MKIPTKIINIRQETPIVKVLTLDLQGQAFNFLPGQWIDCYAEIDGKQEIAGYSLASSPTVKDTVEIAVREGDSPVTRFIHESAKVGDALWVDGGQGDNHYTREMGERLVLIAGGIGIAPLMSVLRYVDCAHPDVEAALIYSARSPSHIIYHEELSEMAEGNENIRCIFTVTQPVDEAWEGYSGRIDASLFEKAGIELDSLFFISGPPEMIDYVAELVEGLGVPWERVRYEKWW